MSSDNIPSMTEKLAVSTGSSSQASDVDDRVSLRDELLRHAVDLVRRHGPDKLSLREVQRLAGVSPAAAYRHYRDREALMLAVGQRASALLSDRISAALEATSQQESMTVTDGRTTAIRRLRAGSAAYIDFAKDEPGWFRAVFTTGENPEQLETPDPASRGASGHGPYELLKMCIEDLQARGVLGSTPEPWSDTAIWAATHGMAELLLNGPLRHLEEAQADAAVERLLDLILAGLTHPAPS